jgi:rubrerythrin
MGEAAMERFIRRENIKHYRELLKTTKDEAERQKILKLLAEEQRKQKDAGDKVEG